MIENKSWRKACGSLPALPVGEYRSAPGRPELFTASQMQRYALAARAEQQVDHIPDVAKMVAEQAREIERAGFRAWVLREWPGAPLHYIRDALPENDPRYGEFCDESLQRAWVGWQARAAQPDHSERNLDMVHVCKLGMHGAAYDAPDTCRAYTYAAQPGNDIAYRLGACLRAAHCDGGGDFIDFGLALLRRLQDRGFGGFQIDAAPPTSMSAAISA